MNDMSKLVVGHRVVMGSGPYACLGTVVKVTQEDVIVRTDCQSNITLKGQLCRFDFNGKACDSSDLGYESMTQKGGIPGTHECGPWELSDDEQGVRSLEQQIGQDRERLVESRRRYEERASKLKQLGGQDALAGKPLSAFYDIPDIEHNEGNRERYEHAYHHAKELKDGH